MARNPEADIIAAQAGFLDTYYRYEGTPELANFVKSYTGSSIAPEVYRQQVQRSLLLRLVTPQEMDQLTKGGFVTKEFSLPSGRVIKGTIAGV